MASVGLFSLGHLDFVILSPFVIGHSSLISINRLRPSMQPPWVNCWRKRKKSSMQEAGRISIPPLRGPYLLFPGNQIGGWILPFSLEAGTHLALFGLTEFQGLPPLIADADIPHRACRSAAIRVMIFQL